jgi:hypothetical protein
VTGEEEIPEGVVAVLTPDAPDVLSHVSVRARNMRVLFATCHDTKPLDDIKVNRHCCSQARGHALLLSDAVKFPAGRHGVNVEVQGVLP